ncbi:MAG: hypothetical protein ACFFHD_12940 [Promethearchaeota archaeon]
MPEDKEKVEDFISLWKKKMESEIKKNPSAIEQTLDRLKEMEKQNEALRSRIRQNIDLITKTDGTIRDMPEENKPFKIEIKESEIIGTKKIREVQHENIELSERLENLTQNLQQKDNLLKTKDSNLSLLQNKVKDLSEQLESVSSSEKEKSVLSQASPQILEMLCQDLQADLNKYKRIVEQLTLEKKELQETVKSSGSQLKPEELEELKKENEELKAELSILQTRLQSKINEPKPQFSAEIYEKQIKELHEQIKEKDILINELKTSQVSQISDLTTPITNLVEELQSNINKLKVSLEEKNKIIHELKSS